MKLSIAVALLTSAVVYVTAQDTSCTDGEALVDFSLLSKDKSETLYPMGQYSFSLLDTTTGNVTFECMDCLFVPQGLQDDEWEDSYTSYDMQVCLPKDHCHRFLIGTTLERWQSLRITDDFESFVLNWDGESLLNNFNAYTFGRIDFGQCESKKCTSDQAEFEFFMTRNQTEWEDTLAWNLTAGDEVLYTDTASIGPSLLRTLECILKDECLTYRIGYSLPDAAYYSIRLDGVMYADGELKEAYPEGSKLQLGQCESSDVCAYGESLFEAQLNFLDTFTKNGTEYYALSNLEVSWLLVAESGGMELFFQDFPGYEFGKSYAVNRCISSDKCSQFEINTRLIEGLDSYTVVENGQELTERKTHGEDDDSTFADYSFQGTTTTGTTGCPVNVWGGEPGSAGSHFVGIQTFLMGVVAATVGAFLA
jgi:hypothetical protein